MYNTFQYFLARNIIQLPELVLIPLLWVWIYYFMINLSHTVGQFMLHFLIAFLLSFCGSSLGLILGSVVMDASSAVIAAPAVIFPLILFSGFFKNREDLPIWASWVEYISLNKYGFVAFMENEVAFKPSKISSLNFQVSKWQAVIYLAVLGIVFRIIALINLGRTKTSKD